MIEPRLFLCGGERKPRGKKYAERRTVELRASGTKKNVNISIENLTGPLLKNLDSRYLDLLEIAAYVFSADCATRRGNGWIVDGTIEPWSRDLSFVIPVRDLNFWRRKDVSVALTNALTAMSNDRLAFRFVQLSQPPPEDLYFPFTDSADCPFEGVERVLMFSGGLDSLAGALETAAGSPNLVLVSHRSTPVMNKRQRQLVAELRRDIDGAILHIPVWVNKDRDFGREHTQRTRSFLFAVLGTVVASSIGSAGVRFFENGIVSLNWPVADEVIRARASQTTHPLTLDLLEKFLRLVVSDTFGVDNPYVFKTKTDVVETIMRAGGSRLIPYSCSCAYGMFKTKSQHHCGTCSQCIDRRFAVLAAGADAYDPDTDYECDVFLGPRKNGQEKNIGVNYVRHGLELARMSAIQMAAKFNLELSRAVRCFSLPSSAAQKFLEMHQRHGSLVKRVLETQVKSRAERLLEGELERSSLLGLVIHQDHLPSSWISFVNRLTGILRAGLPKACASEKPKNERHLQEICDGLMTGHDESLVREYPHLRWSSVLTKPDWYVDALSLLIEAKYPRKKSDVRRMTEEIAADITKYGDNNKRVLFVVYDPHRMIIDDDEFSAPIVKRSTMRVSFVR